MLQPCPHSPPRQSHIVKAQAFTLQSVKYPANKTQQRYIFFATYGGFWVQSTSGWLSAALCLLALFAFSRTLFQPIWEATISMLSKLSSGRNQESSPHTCKCCEKVKSKPTATVCAAHAFSGSLGYLWPKGCERLKPAATSHLLSSVIALLHAFQPQVYQPINHLIHPTMNQQCSNILQFAAQPFLQVTGPPWFCSPQALSPLFLAPTLYKDSTAALGEGLATHW